MAARGFHPAALSGQCSEIEWFQSDVLTKATLNAFWNPLGAMNARELADEEGGQHADYPNQSKTEPRRMAMGASGIRQPSAPIFPFNAPAVSGAGCYMAVIHSFVAGKGGEYKGSVFQLTGPLPLGGEVLELDTDSAGDTDYIINTMENFLTTHAIPKGSILQATPSPAQADGTATWAVNYDPSCYRKFQYVVNPSNANQYLFQGLRTHDDDHANTGISWETLLTFDKSCAS
jgi:hypothetical protein